VTLIIIFSPAEFIQLCSQPHTDCMGCLRECDNWLGIRYVCGHANPVTWFTHTALNLNALKHIYKP